MNNLTNKDRRDLLQEFSPRKDGYVLNLTRTQFEEFVEDTIDLDISETEGSNGNRLKSLLKSCTDEQVDSLIAALRAL